MCDFSFFFTVVVLRIRLLEIQTSEFLNLEHYVFALFVHPCSKWFQPYTYVTGLLILIHFCCKIYFHLSGERNGMDYPCKFSKKHCSLVQIDLFRSCCAHNLTSTLNSFFFPFNNGSSAKSIWCSRSTSHTDIVKSFFFFFLRLVSFKDF